MDEKILKSLKIGTLRIGEKELNCAVLEDGSRVLTTKAVFKAFGRPRRSNIKVGSRVPNMPSFLDAKSLQPFVSQDLLDMINSPVTYKSSAKSKKATIGYKAEILPLLCDVYLNARQAGALAPSQQPLAVVAELLVRALSKVGIVALVDEATGYQEEREQDALQKLLSIYLSEEKLKWAKMFPDEFYRQLFRLKGWAYNPMDVKRPKYVGKLTNQLVYEKLPPKVLDELKKLNPVKNKKTYRRESTHHQYLSADIGQPDLRDHLLQLIAIMKVSPNWSAFMRNFNRAFPPPEGEQLSLFEELEENYIDVKSTQIN